MNTPQMIDKANAIAAHLSYDELTPSGSPKAMLKEMSREIGGRCVSVYWHDGGFNMRTAYGQEIPMTFKESILWKLFGCLPNGYELRK